MKTSGQPSPFKICLLIVMFLSYTDTYVFSAPRGGHVVSGTASFTQEGNLTVITAGNRSIINYTGFDIGKNQTVQFIQPSATATVLNRVTSPDPTSIFGRLESNGIVIIANPYGVFFENGSVVNVGGLIAGAGKISDADFTAGKIHFTDLTGDVRNDGVIAADNQIALMGANVVNTGSATAARGVAMMVSGPDVYVGEKNGNIFVQANGKALTAAAAAVGTAAASAGSVTNSGTVAAPRVLLGAGDLYSTAIVNSGLLQGRAVAVNAGRNGSATITGKVDATSAHNPNASGTGGTIDVLGGTVALKGATLDASGDAGGGNVRVGGDFHGASTLAASTTTTVDAASTVKADATGATGNGGTVVLWSGSSTSFSGNISARGGAAGGNGGSVEVSSAGKLAYQGFSDLRATAGSPGSLLLDPANYVIDTTAVDAYGYPANTSIMVATVLAAQIAAGPVSLSATNDIIFRTDVTVLTPNTNNLTLGAGRSIYIGDPGTNPLGATNTPPATNAALSLNGAAFTATYNSTGATAGLTNARFRMSGTSSITTPGAVMISDGGVDPGNTVGIIALNITTSTGAAGTAGGITLDTSAGAGEPIALNGVLTASGTGANNTQGGAVMLKASGAITGGGAITATGTGTSTGGAISLTADGGITVGALTADGATGNGGTVTLLSSAPNAAAAGAFTTGNLDTSSTGATGGTIAIGAPAAVGDSQPTSLTVGTINTKGTGTTNGGTINLQTSGVLTLATNAPSFTGNTTILASNTTAAGATTPTSFTTQGYDFSLTLTGAAINASQIADTPRNLTLVSTAGIKIDEAAVTSTGNQTYTGPVTLTATAAGITLQAGTGVTTGAISFSTTLDDNASGTHALTLIPGSGGGTTFGGTVGTTPLASLTATTGTTGATNSTVPVLIDGAGVTTTGAQSYGTITLNGTTATSPVTLTGSGISSGAVTGNAHPLTVDDAGTATFAAINSGAAVTFDGAGATVLNGTIVAPSLSVTGGTGVTLNAGNAGGVSTVTTNGGGQTYEKLTLGANTTLGDAGAGNIIFNGTIDATSAGAQALTVGTDGTITFQGAVGSSQPLSALATQGISTGTAGTTLFDVTGGGTTVATQANTGSGAQYYANAVVLGAGTTLQSTFAGGATVGGPVTFASTVGSSTAGGATTPENLTVTSTGLTTFGGQVGGSSLTATAAPALGVLAVTNAAQINATTVTTVDPQTYGSLTLGGTGTTTLASTTAQAEVSVGAVTGGNNGLTVAVNPASIYVSSFGAITTTGALNFTLGTSTNFTGAINAGSVDFQTSVVDGAFYFSGGTVATKGGQTYGGANGVVALSAPLALSDTNKGNISLPLVTSAGASNALTISTGGTTTFNNTVGTLGGATLNLASVQVGLAGGANLGGTVQFGGNSITTNGAAGQVYNDKATLAAATTLNAGSGQVTFAQSLGSATTPEALTIGTTGTTTFGGAVGGTATAGAAVLAAPALASLTLTGSGPVALDGGNVTTVTTPGGTQNYGTGAVTLGANTVLTGYSATFGGGITEATAGTYSLTLNFASQVTLPGTGLLTDVGDFTSEGAGGVLINSGISTYGSQTYSGGAVTIATGAPTSLTLQAGTGNAAGSITISSPLDEQTTAGLHNLTLIAGSAGMVTLGAPVGASLPLLSVTSSGQPTTISGGGVTTTASQTYGPLTLGGTTTLTSTGAGTISAGTVTGADHTFNVSAIGTGGTSTFAAINDAGAPVNFEVAGVATFNGAITASSFGLGTTTAGTRGVFNAGGATVSTTAGQTYGEEIYLGAATILADTTGTISLQGVDSATATAESLTVNTSGATIFGGAVGAANALASVTTDAGGSTQINGGSVQTTGAQLYHDAVTLGAAGAATVLNAGTGTVTFAQTLQSAGAITPQALTINTSGTTTFGGAVGGPPGTATAPVTAAPALASLSVTGGGVVDINGNSVTTVTTSGGAQTYGTTATPDQVVLGADTLFKGYSATFSGGLTSAAGGASPYSLTLDLFSQVTLPGAAALTGIRDFTSEGPGGVLINNDISTGGNQSYLNGAVTIAANVTLTAGTTFATGSLTLGAPVDDQTAGTHTLTLISGTSGGTKISAPVGATHPLLSLTATARQTTGQTTTADQPVTIDATSVTTTGSQNYGALILANNGPTTLASTATTGAVGINSGPVTVSGNPDPLTINVASANGSSTIGTITGAGTLTLTMGGTSTFGTINDAAPVIYSGGTVDFSGLGATDVTVAATGAANFNGTVGASGTFLSDGTGTTTFNAPVSANSLTVTGGTSVTLDAGTVTTTAGQTYAEPALVASTTTLTDGTTLSLLKVDSATATPEALTVSAPVTVFGGAVGSIDPLASLTTEGTTAEINGGSIATSGLQQYNTAVTLGAPTTLTAGAGAVTFAQTLGSAASPQTLVIDTTGTTTFDKQVGGAPGAAESAITTAPALASLAVNGGGPVDINGGGVTMVTTAGGSQTYTGQVSLSATAELKGNSLGLAPAGLTGGGFNLTLDFVKQITVPDAITGVGTFMTVGAGGALVNGSFTTTGSQTYSGGNVALAGTPVLISTAGSLIFDTPVAGNAPLTLHSATGTIFAMNATAQGGVNAASLTTTGPVLFNETGAAGTQPDVQTTGAQTYVTGAVTLGQNTFLTSSGTASTGAISFGTSAATAATVDSAATTAHSLTLSTLGTQTFYGLVGSTMALSALTTGTGATVFTMTIPTTDPSVVAAGVRVAGPVMVNGAVTFDVTGSTLAQPSLLTLGALGTQTYAGVVTLGSATHPNAVTVLNSATTDAAGMFTGGESITFDGDIVAASAAVTPEFDVRAGLGDAEFDGSVNTTGDFAPGTASVTFHGNVGTAASPLGVFTVLPNDASNGGLYRLDLNGQTITTLNGSQSYLYPTVLSADTVINAGTAGGTARNVTFGAALDGSNLLTNNPYSLTINVNGGTIAFNGLVGASVPLLSLTTGNIGPVLGTTQFNMPLPLAATGLGGVTVVNSVAISTNTDFETAGVAGTTGPTILTGFNYRGLTPAASTQSYGVSGSGAAITVGQNTILQDLSAAGGIEFLGNVDARTNGGASLSVNANGNESFSGLVGHTFALSSLSTDNVSGGTGSTLFDMDLMPAGTTAGVRVTGTVNINDAVQFSGDGTSGVPTVLSGGAQTYAKNATVAANTVLTAGSGNIVFGGAVDSGSPTYSALTVNTPGDEIFNGLVGSSAPLASLTTDATGPVGGTTRFVLTLPATGLATGVGGVNTVGAVTLNDAVLFQVANTSASQPSVVSGGTQTYNGGAILGAATILTSSAGSILFNSTLDSDTPATPRDLATNTPAVGSVAAFEQTVGGTSPLASLTTNGNGTTQINGGITANADTITTTGSQEYLQAVTLGDDTRLHAGGNVDFGNVANGNLASSLDGTHSLTVDAAAASFEAVGNDAPLVNLTVNAAGTTFSYTPTLVSPGHAGVNLAGKLTLDSPVFFNAAGAGNVVFVRTGVAVPGVTAASAQSYLGTFALAGNATFTDLQSGGITFQGAVDGSGVANLTASTGGAISFLAPVGAGAALSSLTTSNLGVATGQTILGGGSVLTTGAQTYGDAVALGATTILTSNAGGNILFALTLDSVAAAAPQMLTVDTAGATIFDGAVGAANALASVTTDAPGSTQINGGSVTTTGAQTYHDPATLGANTVLASTAGGNISFGRTLNSATPGTAETLTVNTAGATIFYGAVGATNELASVTTDAPGGTQIDGGSVTTTGAQTYGDAVTLGADATLTSTGNGVLAFNGTVDGAFALQANTAGLTIFNQPVGNAAALTGLTTDSAGATQFNMPVGSVAGVVVNGPVTINDSVSFTGTGASLALPTVLTIGNGKQTYGGVVSVGTNTFLVSAAALPGTAGAFTGGGSVAFNATQGIGSTGGQDLYVRAGAGVATVDSTVNANTVDLGGAAVTFAGPVNLPGTVSVEPNGGGGGSILFSGGTITTLGAQVYNVPFVLGCNAILTSTGGGSITFNAALDGAFALTLDSTGDEVFKGQVGGAKPLTSLTTDNPALIQPGGHVVFAFAGTTASPSVTTTGAQTFNDAATLDAATVLASTGGSIVFASTVDGAQALTLNAAGDEVFDGRVGGTVALASLTTDDAAGTISGGHVIFNVAGGSTTAAPGVTTTGAQTYNDAALLDTNTVLASTGGGALTFKSTVDAAASGAQSLTLNTAGNEMFFGVVGGTTALASLVTDDPAANSTGGEVIFDVSATGRSVTTTGAQTYHDAVSLLADTTLASTNNGAVTFGSTVDGPQALTVGTGGLTTFAAPVGSGVVLAGLTTRGGGAVALDGGVVNTTGLQSYGGVVTLGADSILTSSDATTGGIIFAATVDSDATATPRALTLDAAGNETFGGSVGGGAPLASLTTDATGAGGDVVFGIVGGTLPATLGVTTVGTQTYHDAALLQTNTVLTSTNGGALTFGSTVDGAAKGVQALTLNTSGDAVFDGLVGNTTALDTLTTSDPAGANAGGRVLFNAVGALAAPSVTTTGAQTYNDALLMQADTVLTSKQGGTLTFESTVDGEHALSLNSSGEKIFYARVGGSAAGPLASLTTGADTANTGGRVVFNFGGTPDAPSVTTSGAQNYHDPVSMRADTVLTSTGDGVTFGSTVDGTQALALNAAGDVTFRDAVGSKEELTSLLIDGYANLQDGHVIFEFAGTGGTPSVQTTGAQTYHDAALLHADTFLASTQGGALTFNTTIDGAQALTLSTVGTTTFDAAIGGSPALTSLTVLGNGPVALNAGSVNTTGAQAYTGAVNLVRDASLTSSGSGITFDSTVDGANRNLTVTNPTAKTATTFGGAVGATGALSTLTASDGSAVIINGGSVTTLNLQTYGGEVDINRADGGTTTLSATNAKVLANGAQGNNLIFKQNVNADSGSLLVEGYRILAESGSNIEVANAGTLNLEASNTLILQGTDYGSVTGAVLLNSPASGAFPNPATRASIFLTNQGRTLFHGGNFTMGYLQNMFSEGSIAINVLSGGTATLSDIAAEGTLTVQAPQIVLLARNQDPVRGAANRGTDDGLNFVARTSINFGNSPIRYDNQHSSNDIANFVTSNGQVTVNRDSARGISIFQDPTLAATFAQDIAKLDFTDADFDTFDLPFQPISGGTQTIDTAAALSGALPDQKPIDVAVDITISASQLEELLKLGIHPRKAQKQERLSLASKRALFAQLVDGLDKDNYGRLQPIKGGISTLVPSDYVVVVDRMSEHEVQAILTAFEELYGKNKEKVPPIGEAFNTAFNDYSTEKQTADPAGLAAYIAAKPGKYPEVDKAVRGFDNLFGYIEHLGLTDKEQAKAKEHIASDLHVAGPSADDMVKVIDALRAKIPKDQKASSTKLPPSAPAGNPAPGATSPGQPEQKKGTPPLKTARQARPDSTRQTARHALPATDDGRAHEVAGL